MSPREWLQYARVEMDDTLVLKIDAPKQVTVWARPLRAGEDALFETVREDESMDKMPIGIVEDMIQDCLSADGVVEPVPVQESPFIANQTGTDGRDVDA